MKTLTTKTFPVLLTVAQPRTTVGDYQFDDLGYPRDVFKGQYQQGATVHDDSIVSKTKWATDSWDDEVALTGPTAAGEFLLQRDDNVYLACLKSKEQEIPLALSASAKLSLLPENQGILVSSKESQFQSIVLHSKDGLPQHEVYKSKGNIEEFHTSENGTLVIDEKLGKERRLLSVDLSTGQTKTLLPGLRTYDFALSPGGDFIAFVDSSDGLIYSQNLATSEKKLLSDPEMEDPTFSNPARFGLNFTPDGSRVIYTLGTSFCEDTRESIYSQLIVAPTKGGDLACLAESSHEGFYMESAQA